MRAENETDGEREREMEIKLYCIAVMIGRTIRQRKGWRTREKGRVEGREGERRPLERERARARARRCAYTSQNHL